MPTYPVTIRRCQHIKVNGIQCGSPAKHDEMHCFFHEQCRLMTSQINMKFTEHDIIRLPTLEDANSIQLGLAEVMRLLVTHQIDHHIASLLLRALRTAASNLKFLTLEPKPTHIVIDPKCVLDRPLGATAWSTKEGREYDIIETSDNSKPDGSQDKWCDLSNEELDRRHVAQVMRLWAGLAQEWESPNTPAETETQNSLPQLKSPGLTENCP